MADATDPTDLTHLTDMSALSDRLTRASAAFQAFRPAVEAGDPWPLSPAYGSEPESDWGPKELLAHTAEMLGYWPAEIDRISGGGPAPVPFGRVSTDQARIERIGRDRELPTAELFERIGGEASALGMRIRALAAADAARLGLHPRLGEMTVGLIIERFLVGHLEEHVEQLRGILATSPAGSPG
jgi:DinB family protein